MLTHTQSSEGAMAHCYLFQRTNLLYLPKHVRNIRSSFQFSGVIFISNVRDSNIIIIHTDENDYNFEFDSRIVNFSTCVRCVCVVFFVTLNMFFPLAKTQLAWQIRFNSYVLFLSLCPTLSAPHKYTIMHAILLMLPILLRKKNRFNYFI